MERDSDQTFEVSSAVYALPIAEVHEVAEAKRICCVPTLGRDRVGVMNWHGDALPVVSAHLLFDTDSDEETGVESDGSEASLETVEPLAAGHVLVVSGRDDEPARLGLPIDRVIGLVDGPKRRRGGQRLIVERRPENGRVLNVLDPKELVARATAVIGQPLG